MFKFGKASLKKLENVHFLLQKLAKEVIIRVEYVDFAIIWGYRDKATQDSAYRTGHSGKKWPNSKHNKLPSLAIDIAVYKDGKLSWDPIYYYYLAGVFFTVANELGIKIRWGGNFDGDSDFKDQKLYDLGHYELSN